MTLLLQIEQRDEKGRFEHNHRLTAAQFNDILERAFTLAINEASLFTILFQHKRLAAQRAKILERLLREKITGKTNLNAWFTTTQHSR